MTELAERVGTSRNQIYKLEVGERQLTLEWMQRLAKAIGCRVDEIISGEMMSSRLFRIPPLKQHLYEVEQHENCLVLKIKAPTEIHLSLHPAFETNKA
jgi:DNA-binding Xre family transcriptional regulator